MEILGSCASAVKPTAFQKNKMPTVKHGGGSVVAWAALRSDLTLQSSPLFMTV